MPRKIWLQLILAVLVLSFSRSLLVSLPADHGNAGTEDPIPGQVSKEVSIHPDVQLKKLADGVWLHTTYQFMEDYGRVPGNGLLVVDGTNGVLVDLPWTNEQAALIFDWAKKELGVDIEAVIPTHSHSDCIGGLAEAHRRGAKSYAHEKTAAFAREKGEPVPQVTFKENLEVNCGSIKLIADYQGGGHTVDNIVVWLPARKILFGGCMVKSLYSKTLGYTKEADLKNWPRTLRKIKTKYSQACLVIPGHGDPGGLELLDHTLELLKTLVQ